MAVKKATNLVCHVVGRSSCREVFAFNWNQALAPRIDYQNIEVSKFWRQQAISKPLNFSVYDQPFVFGKLVRYELVECLSTLIVCLAH